MPKPKNKINTQKVEKNITQLDRLDIVYVDADSIHPNEYNPNRQSEHDFELLCRSIEEDGFTQPIIVNQNSKEIVDGEHRWRACKALGMKKVGIVWTDMSPEQQRIATLRHNRARGSENINMASEVLKELQSMGSIESARESLMLDEIDLTILLKEIPSGEIHLRNADENYSASEIETMLKEEQQAESNKKQEEVLMSIKDQEKYTFQFTYPWTEGWIVERLCLGRNKSKNKATELVALCQKWGHID
jgi:ParB-like chromosome segregation protein Spo0J